MGTGYVRADSTNAIANGKLIDADVFDNEFDAIVAAFDSSTGHTHDGTSAEGAPVTVLGPAQETVQDGTALYPKADGIYDLGKSTQEWKDLYIDGVAYIDTLDLAGTQVTSIDTDLSSVSASDDTLASAKAIKTYVDALVTAQDLDFQADTGGALSIDLDSETLTIAGGAGIDTSGVGNTVTVAIDSTVATLTGTQTLTNKSVNLANNTLTGTTAEFNAALSDNDFATLAGTETLTSKTVNLANNTLTGTTAEFNTALSDGSFATLAGTETLTSKTLTSPVIDGSPDFSGAVNKDTVLSDLGGTATGVSVFKASDQSAGRTALGLDSLVVPTGAVFWFAADAAPTGYLECDGSAVSRTTYSALFAVVGTVFGTGDGSTTFNIPDLRGEFVRGWDNGRGVDASRAFGSTQTDAFEAHTHQVEYQNGGTDAGAQTTRVAAVGAGGTFADSESTGDTETRPRNVALLPCIKI